MGNNEALMLKFTGIGKVEQITKDISMKSTFKIELDDKDKNNRDTHS